MRVKKLNKADLIGLGIEAIFLLIMIKSLASSIATMLKLL